MCRPEEAAGHVNSGGLSVGGALWPPSFKDLLFLPCLYHYYFPALAMSNLQGQLKHQYLQKPFLTTSNGGPWLPQQNYSK